MLSSGPKSYYDEYVRKKDTERAFAKPPALLTDRNAYINFLEIQLERVSAACFAVNGHETRFNDMQGLVVSLDEKLNATSRMISVAQQSTEEVRSEFFQRAEIESNAAKAYRLETRKSIDGLTSHMLQIEKMASLLPQIEGKLNAMDKRMGEYENKQRGIEQDSRTANKLAQERIDRLDSVTDELHALIESTRASVSRVTFDVEENTNRVNNYISGVEGRITQALQDNKDDLQREMMAVHAKSANQYEEVRKLIEVRELEMLTTTRKHHKAIQDEIEENRRKWSQDLDNLTEHLQTDATRKVEKVQYAVQTSLQELKSSHHQQAAMMCDIEDSVLSQLQTVQARVEKVRANQETVENKLNTSSKSLEDRMQELQTTLQNTTQASHPVWGPPGFYPAASFHAPTESQPNGASFVSNGGVPLSPVSRAADGSFFYGGYPLNASFAPAAGNMASATGKGLTNTSSAGVPPPFPSNVSETSSVMPGSPMSLHQHRQYQNQQQHHQQQQQQQQHQQQCTSESISHVTTTYNNDNKDSRHARSGSSTRLRPVHTTSSTHQSNSRPASVSRRFAQAAARSRSVSPASSAVYGATGSKSKSKGTRRRPVDASAEVIQQFLEIYDADQQEIAKRLESMGAPPIVEKESVRTKYQQSAALGETPGEVLGNFFLSYKKDRQNILERLNSLAKSEPVQREGQEEYLPEQSSFSPRESQPEPVAGASIPAAAAAPPQSDEQGSVASGVTNGSVASSDPAGHVVHNILSRSMDDFMKTYRHRGGGRKGAKSSSVATADKPRRSVSPAMHSDDDHSRASQSMHQGQNNRSASKSPSRLRLRTGALLTSLRDSQGTRGAERFKRYMQLTESQSLARSMSPNGTIGAVDVSAVRWEYDHVLLKPVWKLPNTYQSPGRTRSCSQGNSQNNSQSNSRAGSISPGARTTSTLIERLAQQDRYAMTHGAVAGAAAESAGPAAGAAVSFNFTARGQGTVLPTAQGASVSAALHIDSTDCVSVASSASTKTVTTTSATNSTKHE